MNQTKVLHLLGVSYRTAPASVREALSYGDDEARRLLDLGRREQPQVEALLLSTCNRTELYLAAPADSDADRAWLQLLRHNRPDAPVLRVDCMRYHLAGSDAAQHLARLACGLESAVLGDVQILGQLKEALSVAAASGTVGPYLRQVFKQAIYAGRRARRETTISRGSASVGSAVAGMVMRHCDDELRGGDAGILIIGAGKAAQHAARHLAKCRCGAITIVNRTDSRAEKLASQCGGEWRPWPELLEAIEASDVVVAATAASQPILDRTALEALAYVRAPESLFIIDAGLPRNVEPGSPFTVIDIDAIRGTQDEASEQREAAVPQVEHIVGETLASWQQWLDSQPLEQAIKSLYLNADELKRRTAESLLAAETLTRDEVERIVGLGFKHLLHDHARYLRESSGTVSAETEGAMRDPRAA